MGVAADPLDLPGSASLKTSSVPLSAANHTGTETGVPSRLKVVMLTKRSLASAALSTSMNFLLQRSVHATSAPGAAGLVWWTCHPATLP
jgi:hypothetical protein